MNNNEQLEARVAAVMAQMAQNEVFGDTFSPRGLAWAKKNMGGIAQDIAVASARVYPQGMPEWDARETVDNIAAATQKTSAFAAALTMGEIADREALTQFGVAVNGMYLNNDSIDGGGKKADRTIAAVGLLSRPRASQATQATALGGIIRARWAALDAGITGSIRTFASADDAPYVVEYFNEDVLYREAGMQKYSRLYAAAQDRDAFLAANAVEIATHSVITAGLPAILTGLHALYRQESGRIPPLSEVLCTREAVRLLRIGNFYCRVLDDLGDAPRDGRGLDNPEAAKNSFMLNMFNQYGHRFVQEYLEMGEVTARQALLHNAIAEYKTDETAHGDFIRNALNGHIRKVVAELPPDFADRFHRFVTIFKRIIEIAYVNAQGDEALARLGTQT